MKQNLVSFIFSISISSMFMSFFSPISRPFLEWNCFAVLVAAVFHLTCWIENFPKVSRLPIRIITRLLSNSVQHALRWIQVHQQRAKYIASGNWIEKMVVHIRQLELGYNAGCYGAKKPTRSASEISPSTSYPMASREILLHLVFRTSKESLDTISPNRYSQCAFSSRMRFLAGEDR
jgi:hypothetical protein